ncbi:YvrJ family protein|uniref:YvrJ protein family protein n=1 Tax=Dendrosporobacter quercicolus TaxID=146817 RepID=A0A1G9WTC7_9FIRM|nr:YvrJ family protein [Dendrosporobacter quercicolus]NSL49202.1 YvrJ family protein [Dendrosporobacter quercicolus DSM 1736]SDM87501.1 YvrJ protein family protein [Dendrosporobacter quercicolus]
MEQMLDYAVNYGFAMAVAVYLLVRMEGRLDQLTVSINELSKAITAKL